MFLSQKYEGYNCLLAGLMTGRELVYPPDFLKMGIIHNYGVFLVTGFIRAK